MFSFVGYEYHLDSALVINKQTNKPWTWSKLKRMTLGPLRPLRPFTVGYWWTKSCKPDTGKAHNTFTNVYSKDLTWSDDKNMYLGPVVAAQQVLDPSPQTSCPRKEKKGGAHPLQPSLQVVINLILGGKKYKNSKPGVGFYRELALGPYCK